MPMDGLTGDSAVALAPFRPLGVSAKETFFDGESITVGDGARSALLAGSLRGLL